MSGAPGALDAQAWRETTVRVRYAETDCMGIAYHASYLVWFEVGRTHWIRGVPSGPEAGAPPAGTPRSYADLERAGYFLPVIEAASRYHWSARYDEEVAVRTRLTSCGRVRMAFEYEALRLPDRKLLATGRTEHAVTDASGRPCRLPPEWLAWLMDPQMPIPDRGSR